MDQSSSRREFLKTSFLATAGIWIGTGTGLARKRSANEKLNIGIVGTINRARANLSAVRGENIVAICDVDDHLLAAAGCWTSGTSTP